MMRVSVVTPTLRRPREVEGLLKNLSQQVLLPFEVVIVDGAPESERETEYLVSADNHRFPFRCHYTRRAGGTAIQRNVGIDRAGGDFVAFVDDDIRLAPDFLETILAVFAEDFDCRIGGIAGYITNKYLNPHTSPRWRWYRRLRLFATYEPGRYDFETGYPINRYLQAPHCGLKEIDFMGAGCAVWRREVFDSGLRFAPFFTGYGLLEDAHLALRAGRKWKLLECGSAHCVHLSSQKSREDYRQTSRKTATNYRYVFVDLVPDRTCRQEFRFWRIQIFDLIRFVLAALRNRNRESWLTVLGKIEGIAASWRI